MSSKAEDLAAKAARLRARASSPPSSFHPVSTDISSSVDTGLVTPAAAQVPLTPVAPSVRTKPVRLTVDIPPADHAALVRLAVDAATQLGATRVPGQELVRALIHRMLSDPQLQQQIVADVDQVRRRR